MIIHENYTWLIVTEVEKILKYEDVLQDCLKDYFMPPEAVQVSPLIPFSPMPGGALTANTQMMRDNNMLNKFPEVIKAMREVVEKGGYGTSVTPVSQFYFQQAFNNVMFGSWKKIADGYGKMVLGYFGKTPCAPDDEVIKLASEQLKLEPTTENAIDIADRDETKSLAYSRELLENEGIEASEENIFIVAACKEKGLAFLKGDAKVNVRKISDEPKVEAKKPVENTSNSASSYTVVVNGQSYSVQVAEGEAVEITSVAPTSTPSVSALVTSSGESICATLPGSVFKLLVKVGDEVKEGQVVIILEAMKMEIEVVANASGRVSAIHVNEGQSVENGQALLVL